MTAVSMSYYQQVARKTAIYPITHSILYPTLGLTGEAGEVADKVKKVIRDKGGRFTDEDKLEIAKELGDVLWYLANTATDLGFDLDTIADMNLDKLNSRKARGALQGSGDNR